MRRARHRVFQDGGLGRKKPGTQNVGFCPRGDDHTAGIDIDLVKQGAVLDIPDIGLLS